MPKKYARELCAICKGVRRLCGASVCPILAKKSFILSKETSLPNKDELSGLSEWFFVGEYGYPRVRMGPISAISMVPWEPERWAEQKLDFTQILRYRILALYPYRRAHIFKPPQIHEPIGESILSVKPVTLDIQLEKPPRVHLKLDADIPPFGGTAPLKKIELEDNPSIPRRVEGIIIDRVKAEYAVWALRRYGLSVYYLQKIFSGGLLGIEERRKVVPTRWSITAVDAAIGRKILPEIKHRSSLPRALVHYWEYLGNKYYIVVIPNDYWAMEMFEIWLPNSVWVRGEGEPAIINVYEDYNGKPNKMDGGYYAMRTPILEWLRKNGRVAAVLAIRIITPKYIAPVGSWQIRESVRLALEEKPVIAGEKDEVLDYIEKLEPIIARINLRSRSWLLKRLMLKPLDEYI